MSNPNPWQQDWQEGIKVTAPHDERKVFRIRAITSTFLLSKGFVPDAFTGIAAEAAGLANELLNIAQQLENNPDADIEIPSGEHTGKKLYSRQEELIREILISPKIVDKPKAEDEIAFEWLTPTDIQFILHTVDKPFKAWARFRPQHAPRLANVSQSEGAELPTASDS